MIVICLFDIQTAGGSIKLKFSKRPPRAAKWGQDQPDPTYFLLIDDNTHSL